MRRSTIAVLAAALSTLVLSGCSSSQLYFGATVPQVTGAWEQSSAPQARLVIDGNGTFRATAWPVAVACEPGSAQTLDDLKGGNTRDLSGTWATFGESAYQLEFLFDRHQCSGAGFEGFIWKRGDGQLDICVIISEAILPDDARARNYLVLRKLPDRPSRPEGQC